MTLKEKRRDPNQPTKLAGDRTAAETAGEETPAPVAPANLSEYMAAMGRKGGLVGGKRRMVTMTKAARSRVAAKAANARWSKTRS